MYSSVSDFMPYAELLHNDTSSLFKYQHSCTIC